MTETQVMRPICALRWCYFCDLQLSVLLLLLQANHFSVAGGCKQADSDAEMQPGFASKKVKHTLAQQS